MYRKCFPILIAFTLLACGDDSRDEEMTTTLNQIRLQQSIWNSSGVTSYIFSYKITPTDCPSADELPLLEITVVEGVIAHIFAPETGDFFNTANTSFLTINGIFARMIEDVEGIADAPAFNATFGYPVSYQADLSGAACDGYRIRVSSLM